MFYIYVKYCYPGNVWYLLLVWRFYANEAMKYTTISLILLALFLVSFTPVKNESEFTFTAGEKLVYRVYYNWNFVWLSAGEISLEIKDEQDLYHIEVTGRTYTSYEWFYKVRDKYHSYIDKKTGLPKLYIRDIQQGDYRHYEKIVFDYTNRKALSYTGRSINELKSTEIVLEKDYYDLISSMYFLRNMNVDKFRKNGRTGFNVILDDSKYELNLHYMQDDDKLKIKDSGTYKAFHAVADVISGNVFKSGVQMNFWISNDSNNLPVMLESPLIVGSVKGILVSYSNLKFPFAAKIK